MKDKIYMFLAFCGFVFILVVCIKNYDGSQELKSFGANTYYVPDYRYTTASSRELYDRLLDRRSITCPKTYMETTENRCSLNAICGSRHRYGITDFFVSWSTLGSTPRLLNKDNWIDNLGFDKNTLEQTDITFGDLFKKQKPFQGNGNDDEGIYDVVEIVAPFSFSYGNVNTNTEDGKNIVIINSSGSDRQKCRITFYDVKNWFCAGTPGQSMEVKNGTGKGTVEWHMHPDYHQTIIGNTKNASITGGSAGNVIGYASKDTRISIEVYNGSWQKINIYDWIMPPKK